MGWTMARRLLDQNREREVRRQGILLDRLAATYARPIAAEIRRATAAMVEAFKITGEVPVDPEHARRLTAIYARMTRASVVAFGQRMQEQGKSLGLVPERKEFLETLEAMARRFMAEEMIRRRITAVADTTRADIMRAVRAGFDAGDGQLAIAQRILGNVNIMAASRAGVIARTETHGAANFGSQEAAKESGLPLTREWISTADERTRQTHADADGQIVGMDTPFDIGGASIMYPGDPAGPAEEVINCRCGIGYIVDEARI